MNVTITATTDKGHSYTVEIDRAFSMGDALDRARYQLIRLHAENIDSHKPAISKES